VVGASRWRTSPFPDAKTRAYLLPVKKSIRATAGRQAGDVVDVEIELDP
jgi:hypothetical protein